jgi:hypothetical protein
MNLKNMLGKGSQSQYMYWYDTISVILENSQRLLQKITQQSWGCKPSGACLACTRPWVESQHCRKKIAQQAVVMNLKCIFSIVQQILLPLV